MRLTLLLFYLLSGFLSQGRYRVVRSSGDEQICVQSKLQLREEESFSHDALHFIPFIPRKFKSKNREVLEIPNAFVDWHSHFFNPSVLPFVAKNEISDERHTRFLRGPPCT